MGLLRTLLTVGIIQALLGNGDKLLSGIVSVILALGLIIGSITIWLTHGLLWAFAFQAGFAVAVRWIKTKPSEDL